MPSDLPDDLKYLEAEIEEDEYEFDAPGENPEECVLGLYRFTWRAVAKLERHACHPNDASFVLAQENFGWSTSTGSQIAIGRCDKGKVLIVFRALLDSTYHGP